MSDHDAGDCAAILDYLHSSCSPMRPYAYAWSVNPELAGIRVVCRTWKGNGLVTPFQVGGSMTRVPAGGEAYDKLAIVAGELLRKLDRLQSLP